MKTLFVRVQPKTGATRFHRCAILFTQDWRRVDVDDATAQRLQSEQMLEVSETAPAGFVDVAAGDSAESTADGGGAGTSADAPPVDPAVRQAAIVEAISGLPKDDAGLWTGGGKPQVAAIEAALGWPITAAERDAACEARK